MRPNVHAVASKKLGGAHLVEKDKWPDHLPATMRQRAADRETAEIAHSWDDHEIKRVATFRIACNGIEILQPTHDRSFSPAEVSPMGGGLSFAYGQGELI